MAREYVKGRTKQEANKIYNSRRKEDPKKHCEYSMGYYWRNREDILKKTAIYREGVKDEIALKRRQRYWRDTWLRLGVNPPPPFPEERMLSRKERAEKKVQNQSKNA